MTEHTGERRPLNLLRELGFDPESPEVQEAVMRVRADAYDDLVAEIGRLRTWLERIARADTLFGAHEWARQALSGAADSGSSLPPLGSDERPYDRGREES